ncbi:hypothetical protein GW17_00057891 [Ensete ventricosum]|nr:hypothetical protein GW17_00057891 [Ensete ventricosum]
MRCSEFQLGADEDTVASGLTACSGISDLDWCSDSWLCSESRTQERPRSGECLAAVQQQMTGLRLLGADAGDEGTSMAGRVGPTTATEEVVALQKKILVMPKEDVRSYHWRAEGYHQRRRGSRS